jgi:hypothetical protein
LVRRDPNFVDRRELKMATVTASEALQQKVETARRLHEKLDLAQKELREVRATILARGSRDVIRRQFRSCHTALMAAGSLLLLDGRFRPRLPSEKREAALAMLRAGKRPIDLRRELGIDSNTARRMRHRELGDSRNLRKLCRLTPEQVEEILSAPRAVTRRVFAEKFGVSMSLISRVRNERGAYRQVYRKATKVLSPPVQETMLSKQEKGELKLKFPRPLMESLSEMAQLAGESVQPYVISLIESQIAEWRAKKIPADFLIKPDNTPAPVIQEQSSPHFARLSEQDEDRILAAWREGKMVGALATCWSRSESSIFRALERAKKREKRALHGVSPEVIQKIIFLSTKKYDDNDEHINIPAIAKAVGESETVVSRVLASHKPLVPASGAIYAHPPRPGGWQRNMVSRAS